MKTGDILGDLYEKITKRYEVASGLKRIMILSILIIFVLIALLFVYPDSAKKIKDFISTLTCANDESYQSVVCNAKEGDANSQYKLAQYLENDLIIQPNDNIYTPVYWYKKSENNFEKNEKGGHVVAQMAVGVHYFRLIYEKMSDCKDFVYNIDDNENWTEALKWFKKASERGSNEAKYYINLLLKDQQPKKALGYLEKSAESYAKAQYELGIIKYNNNNYVQAKSLFNESKANIVDSNYWYGRINYEQAQSESSTDDKKKLYEEAYRSFEDIVNKDNANREFVSSANFTLGLMEQSGLNGSNTPNYCKAYKFYGTSLKYGDNGIENYNCEAHDAINKLHSQNNLLTNCTDNFTTIELDTDICTEEQNRNELCQN